MKIKLKKKESKYAQVHVDMLRNKQLSLKAKGLGAVLESYSNDFDVSLKSIELKSNDGIKSVRSAIKELEDGNYLFRFQTRNKGGLFSTYWAFDSQKLDVDYLKEMIVKLEKVELITKNDLLACWSIPHGNAVIGMPLTASRSTASRQTTTYNNTNYNNTKDNSILSATTGKERGILKNLQSFKAYYIQKHTGIPFVTHGIGYLVSTPFKINDSGYIENMISNKIVTREEAMKVWEYLLKYYRSNIGTSA
ncbi:MAG: hypothetical protein PHU40_06740 [Sulfurimonas sp.]|nr:hypothetical protein [Sulfurimonas sp.]